MNGLSYSMVKAINRYEAIEADGVTLYPVCVAELDEFSVAQEAITFLQQSLPVTLISKPLLQAYYTMEFQASAAGEPSPGLFFRSVLALILAMRVGVGLPTEKRLELAIPVPDRHDPKKLDCVIFQTEDGAKSITPLQFQRLRPILAAQNGIELESEDANPELVQAERELAELNAPKLDYSLESVKASISLISGVNDAEMDEWPILRFKRQRAALQRILGYLNCGMAEAQGAKWNGGNPYPSPLFDRIRGESGGVIPMEKFAGGAGMRAMQNAGKQTT